MCVGGKGISLTQNFTRIKLIGGAYNESGSRADLFYRTDTRNDEVYQKSAQQILCM
jgi:hypothetical protein